MGGRGRGAGCRTELDEVGLVLLVAGGDESVDLEDDEMVFIVPADKNLGN